MNAKPLTEAQRANLKRVRISPVLVRVNLGGRPPRGGSGDMRVLRGLENLGLVEVKPTMAGPAFHLTNEGAAVLADTVR